MSGHNNPARLRPLAESLVLAIPGVKRLGSLLGRVAAVKLGRVPIGLVALIPVAVLLDVFDAADEAFFGPVGMGLAFVAESAFLLAVTGRVGWSLGGAAIDLVPGVDVIPFATIALVLRIVEEWRAPRADADRGPRGPVIDV